MKAYFVGGPLDGQDLRSEELTSIEAEDPATGKRMRYDRQSVIAGPFVATVYTPNTWTAAEMKAALVQVTKRILRDESPS